MIKAISAFRRFKRDEGAVSAVEFALIAPLMAIIYFGCVELSLMMTVDRKVTASTATLGDLTARASAVTDDDLSDIFEATRMVMQPYPIQTAKMRISSLREDNGNILVSWSEGCGETPYTVDQDLTATVPNNIIPTAGTIIMAEMSYEFQSNIGFFFSQPKTLGDTFYLRPRRVDAITRTDDPGKNFTCGYVPGP
ncbi:MAG: TadE/TadG family type IV pilus assembly protein [Pseudomonadota bacterium]